MRNFDIVIQGPVYEHTFHLIEEYKDLSFVNRIIISTWNEWRDTCKKIDYHNIDILINDDIDYAGDENRNKQIVSSLNGLKACSSEYAIKIRSDMLWIKSSMYEMELFFHKYKNCNLKRIDDSEKPLGRIFCAGTYSDFPFHPFDCVFWGYKEDLIDFFNIPLCYEPKAPNYENQTRAETYIASHYYAKFDHEVSEMIKKPELYFFDNSTFYKEAIEKSNSFGSKVLKPFPKSIMKMIFYKQSFNDFYDWDLRTHQNGLWFHEHDKSDEEIL